MEYQNNTNETEYVEKTRQPSYTKKNLIISFIIGAIIGAGGYYLVVNSKVLNVKSSKKTEIKKDTGNTITNTKNKDTKDKNTKNVITVDKKISSVSSIVVKDQPAGLRVVIDSVTLEGSGWVAIHEDRDGELGNILGAQRFDAGTYKGLVDLLRNTVEGGVYYAVIYSDDGDNLFDHKKDSLVTGKDGNVVKSTFNAIRIR
jgi:hypothetical protein